jgi:undecaprenyl-diphosphatase
VYTRSILAAASGIMGFVEAAHMTLHDLVQLDVRLTAQLRLTESHGLWRRLAAFLAHSGDSWFWMAGLGLVWLVTRGEWRARSVLLAAGVVFLALLVMAIKLVVRRRRPEGEWGAIYRNTDPHSFPSGHAARAALLAVMACGLGPAWFGLLVVVWSPLVSLARVFMGVHYLSDILAGAGLGILVGLVMLKMPPLLMALFPFVF